VGELIAAVSAALVPVSDRIGRQLRLRCQGFLSVVLGFTARPIPEPESSAVVPPAPRVVRYAVKNLVANIRVLEPDANELNKIPRREPDRKPTHIARLGPAAHSFAAFAAVHESVHGTNAKCQRAPPTSDDWGKPDPMRAHSLPPVMRNRCLWAYSITSAARIRNES